MSASQGNKRPCWSFVFRMWPPSVNHIWRRGGLGGMYLEADARCFKRYVAAEISSARARGEAPAKPLTGLLIVVLFFFPPDRRRRDIDNLPKTILDACTDGGLWLDDRQAAVKLTAMGNPDPAKKGYFEMAVGEL